MCNCYSHLTEFGTIAAGIFNLLLVSVSVSRQYLQLHIASDYLILLNVSQSILDLGDFDIFKMVALCCLGFFL